MLRGIVLGYCMYLLIFVYICMYWKFTKKHSECICMYLSVSICICLYMTESTCITRLYTVQINSFIASTPASRVVSGPNHGPLVDVEQLAARSLRPSLIARAPGIAIPRWDQGQAAEDVRQRNDIDNWIRRGHVQQICDVLGYQFLPSLGQ